MTNDPNMDEFEQEGFAPESGIAPESNGGFKRGVIEMWRTNPLFKLVAIMLGVGVAIAVSLGVFSSPPPVEANKLVSPVNVSEPPGGKDSQQFIEETHKANAVRVENAIKNNESVMPTPSGKNEDLLDFGNTNKDQPLQEFKAEMERLKQDMEQQRQQHAQQIQVVQQQRPQQQEDDTLAQAMQRQMQQLMEAWAPHGIRVVDAPALKDLEKEKSKEKSGEIENAQGFNAMYPEYMGKGNGMMMSQAKTIVQAGTVNYAQLLMEANSDVPGPILAQILSGPFSGGKAVGRFKTMNDYLVLEFNLVTYKGKDYQVNILALDPDTTLGGMATYVDHRYFDRILLPAAATFAAQFGSTLGQGGETAIVTDNAVLVEQAKRGYKDAIFSGVGQAAQSVAQFLQQEASQIRPLVIVAAGTPMGMFFVSSVKEQNEGEDTYAGQPQGIVQQPGVPNFPYDPNAAAQQAQNVNAVTEQNVAAQQGNAAQDAGYHPASPYGTNYGTNYPTGTGGAGGYQPLPGSSFTVYPAGGTGSSANYLSR